MRRTATIAILSLATGLSWLAGPALGGGLKSYDRVVDLGQQEFTYITNFPRLDEAGNLIDPTKDRPPANGYELEAIDPGHNGHNLGFTLHRVGDLTNLLPGAISGPSTSIRGINGAGHIVGSAYGSGFSHPFFFAPGNTEVTWLKSLPDATDPGGAYGINASDQIVGEQDGKAIFYATPSSEPVELASLLPAKEGWLFLQATDINDRGEIIGLGINPSGKLADFKLEPSAVPEPTTLAVFAVSCLTLMAQKGRRNRPG